MCFSIQGHNQERKNHAVPMISVKLSRFVVPTIGAVTPSLARIHATTTWAMETPFLSAISSTRLTMSFVPPLLYLLMNLVEAAHCNEHQVLSILGAGRHTNLFPHAATALTVGGSASRGQEATREYCRLRTSGMGKEGSSEAAHA